MLILGLIDIKWLRECDCSRLGSERPISGRQNFDPDLPIGVLCQNPKGSLYWSWNEVTSPETLRLDLERRQQLELLTSLLRNHQSLFVELCYATNNV